MNETQSTPNATKPRAAFDPSALVNALREVGATWAETGIGIGRVAIENSAKALERTAKALQVIEEKLKAEAKGDVAKEAVKPEGGEGPVTKRPVDEPPAA